MNQPSSSPPTGFPLGVREVVLASIIGFVVAAVYGVTSYFRLSPETALLRESAMAGTPGAWHKRIALNVGGLTTGLIRVGSSLFTIPPEPRAALQAVRSAEVGVYELQGAAGLKDPGAILARADKAMSARRWDRAVGVSQEKELVAVYVPRRGLDTGHLKCCVLVVQDRNLVVVGASGNLEPLLELAKPGLELDKFQRHFALR